MYSVTARGRPRRYNGQEFNNFWSGGKCWGPEFETRNDVTEDQMADMLRDRDNGMPLVILKYGVVGSDDFALPFNASEVTPPIPEAPLEAKVEEPESPVIPPSADIVLQPPAPVAEKKPWEL